MALLFQLWPIFYLVIVYVQSETLDHRFFLEEIFRKYGSNGTLSYEGFEQLYSNLGLGNSSGDSDIGSLSKNLTTELVRSRRDARKEDSKNLSKDCEEEEKLALLVEDHQEVGEVIADLPQSRHCLTARQLLDVYEGPRPTHSLTPITFLHLCPAIVYELDQHTCTGHRNTLHKKLAEIKEETDANVYTSWAFAILSIFVISVVGLLCVAIVPLLQKSFVSQLVNFLMSLAVGTLLGDAFLHLIPHALEHHEIQNGSNHSHHNHNDAVLKTGLMFLTVVFFFTFEGVLNIIGTRKAKQLRIRENANYSPVNSNINEKDMMELGSVPLTTHSHSHMGGASNTCLMVVLGDGIHNLADGLAIGAAFSGGLSQGFATTVAVFTHELPHELGDFAVLLNSGVTVSKALCYNLVSSILSLAGTLIGLGCGSIEDSSRWIYSITAGSFIYIALVNLVPEVNKQKSSWRFLILQIAGFLCGGAIMGCIALYEESIHNMFSE